ncbi:MAG: hypothetical protein WCL25_01745 [bacterium]
MKYSRPIIFLTVVLILLPAFSFAQEAAKETAAYIPNENDIKSFVYRWFSWMDHQVADFLFIYHLSKDDLVMKFPEAVVHSHDDFKKWYQGVKDNIQSNVYEVGDIKVSQLPKERYKVDLSVRWKAKTHKGESLDIKFKQSWILSVAGSGRLNINRYIVKKIK